MRRNRNAGRNQDDFAGTFDFASEMEKYRNFEKLTTEIVQAFIKAVWVVDINHIEIEYAFEDELQAYLNILQKREEGSVCTE